MIEGLLTHGTLQLMIISKLKFYFSDLNTSNTTEYSTSLLCPRHVNQSLILAEPTQTEASPYWGLHTTVPLYVALIVFPLLNFKNVSFFTKFNSLGIYILALMDNQVLFNVSPREPPNNARWKLGLVYT